MWPSEVRPAALPARLRLCSAQPSCPAQAPLSLPVCPEPLCADLRREQGQALLLSGNSDPTCSSIAGQRRVRSSDLSCPSPPPSQPGDRAGQVQVQDLKWVSPGVAPWVCGDLGLDETRAMRACLRVDGPLPPEVRSGQRAGGSRRRRGGWGGEEKNEPQSWGKGQCSVGFPSGSKVATLMPPLGSLPSAGWEQLPLPQSRGPRASLYPCQTLNWPTLGEDSGAQGPIFLPPPRGLWGLCGGPGALGQLRSPQRKGLALPPACAAIQPPESSAPCPPPLPQLFLCLPPVSMAWGAGQPTPFSSVIFLFKGATSL